MNAEKGKAELTIWNFDEPMNELNLGDTKARESCIISILTLTLSPFVKWSGSCCVTAKIWPSERTNDYYVWVMLKSGTISSKSITSLALKAIVWFNGKRNVCAWLDSLWFRRYISIGYGNPFHKMINWHLCVYAWAKWFYSFNYNKWNVRNGRALLWYYHLCVPWTDKMHIPAYKDLSVQILQTECWNLWLWLILNKSVYGEMALRMGQFLICEWKKDSKSHADKRNLAMSICIISNSWKRFHTQSARYEIFGHWFSTWNSVWHFSSNYWLVDN